MRIRSFCGSACRLYGSSACVSSRAALGIVFSTAFQATGMGVRSLIISLLRQLILILPVAYLLSLTGEVTNVWYAFPIAEAVSLVVSIALYLNLYKKHIITMKKPIE